MFVLLGCEDVHGCSLHLCSLLVTLPCVLYLHISSQGSCHNAFHSACVSGNNNILVFYSMLQTNILLFFVEKQTNLTINLILGYCQFVLTPKKIFNWIDKTTFAVSICFISDCKITLHSTNKKTKPVERSHLGHSYQEM